LSELSELSGLTARRHRFRSGIDIMSRTKTLLIAVTLVFVSTSAFAQDWRAQLKMVEKDLQTQHYSHARKWSIKMINSMSEHLGTGRDASYTMALPVAYRALAEKGLNKPEEADWYWHVATAMSPDVTKNDWSRFGEVGQWAAHHTDDLEATETAVVAVKKAEPKCPVSAIAGGYYQPIRVGAIIDTNGAPRCPTLVSQTEAPTLAYAAFEAIKKWQFQTAAPAKYEVTVNFLPPAE
jgi:hypothetical protein